MSLVNKVGKNHIYTQVYIYIQYTLHTMSLVNTVGKNRIYIYIYIYTMNTGVLDIYIQSTQVYLIYIYIYTIYTGVHNIYIYNVHRCT